MTTTIGQFGKETTQSCVFCCKSQKGLLAAFKDGLKGFLCWTCFRAAVKARSNGTEATEVPVIAEPSLTGEGPRIS